MRRIDGYVLSYELRRDTHTYPGYYGIDGDMFQERSRHNVKLTFTIDVIGVSDDAWKMLEAGGAKVAIIPSAAVAPLPDDPPPRDPPEVRLSRFARILQEMEEK